MDRNILKTLKLFFGKPINFLRQLSSFRREKGINNKLKESKKIKWPDTEELVHAERSEFGEIKVLERDITKLEKDIEETWLSEPTDSRKYTALLEGDTEAKDSAEVETTSSTTKGLPIKLVAKKIKNDPMSMLEFKHSHPVEDIYEYIKLSLATNNIKSGQRIPFEHLETDCDFIINKKTVMISSEAEASNIIIKRPDVYYRSDTDPERFPCECLCIVDDKTFELFRTFEDLEEKAEQISVFSRLSRKQREFVFSMSSRPIQKDEGQNENEDVFTPIRDIDSLEMMYEVCKYTYKPSVRSRIESLKAQLRHTHGSDKTDLINQLAFAIAIDTEASKRPKRTYEECMAIMDKHTYGLQEIKENIVEFIIAMQETGSSYFVLLLVGPPGVGKTSLAEGVAECMWNIPILQIDCSGADILKLKGLFKSYGGAKPGEVADGFRDEGKTDVIVLFDELDKMESGRDGDPRGALIKPLGPQRKFYDEYVADDIDVSATKFIATANDINKIPGYILSRFENCIFEIKPYTEVEKIEIAQKHLIPKILSEFKLSIDDCLFDEQALKLIIRDYCDDEGVRDLSGNIKILVRKIITERSRGFIKLPFCVETEYVESRLKKKIATTQKRKIGFGQ